MDSVGKAIKEANDLADRLIEESQEVKKDLRAWHKKPCNISNGQAVMLAMVAVILILIL